jgi:hypothetical protein
MQTKNRMKKLPVTLATLLIMTFTAICEQNRPYVVFIVSDDLNCYLGAYGNKDVVSPNIDKLAAEGTVFSKAACQFPVCGPSRSSFMTGLRPNTINIVSNGPSLYKTNPGVKSIPSYFKSNGYVTARAGKIFNHVDNSEKTDWDFILDAGISPEARKRANLVDFQLMYRKAGKVLRLKRLVLQSLSSAQSFLLSFKRMSMSKLTFTKAKFVWNGAMKEISLANYLMQRMHLELSIN